MNVERWLIRQEPQWLEFEQLLNRAEMEGIQGLSAAEICRLSRLYRLVSADLARAKTRRLGSSIINYLQGLTLRGYSQIYQGQRSQDWRKIGGFSSGASQRLSSKHGAIRPLLWGCFWWRRRSPGGMGGAIANFWS